MIALKAINWTANGGGEDPEEAMYKELFSGLCNGTVTDIDTDIPIDATYGHGAGIRIIQGQPRLKKIRLRNLTTDAYSSNYLNGCTSIEEVWLDNTTFVTNSFFTPTNVRYVYTPKATRIQNSINSAPASGAIWDFGDSRTCQQLLDSWSTLFAGTTPNHGWTFRCSDGDVVWDGSAWVKS